MAQQYKKYPIERMQPSSTCTTTINRPKISSTSYGQTTTPKYPTHSSLTNQYKSYKQTKPSTNIVYKSSSTNSNYRTLSALAKTKNDSNKYIRGIVIAAPQNESTHGWIYSKTTNATYQLPYSNTKHYIPDQIVLFNPTIGKLRGLNLKEARILMSQGKMNINNYNNYFISEPISTNIYHTKLYKLSDIHNNYLTENSESIYNKNKFILNTFLNLRENDEIEFKLLLDTNNNKFPMDKMIIIMERYLNGFINAKGGTIYFGIGDNGRIYGESLYNINDRKILEQIQLKICEKLREWKPKKYIQKLISSLTIDIIDIIKIDNKETCGYIIPNKKIIKINITSIYDENKQIIFRNNNCVYVRQLSSLCAYTDITMQQQIGKRQINKLNKIYNSESDSDTESESDIDFDDDDEKDWIDIDKIRKDIKYEYNGNKYYFDGSYAKSITKFISKYT